MPVYDQGYRRWDGEFAQRPLRWWPILRQGVMQFLPQRKYLILMGLAWVAVIFQGVSLFGRLRGADLLESVLGTSFDAGSAFYWGAIELQVVWAMIFTVMVGSDLIAADRRHKALQLYFSKPITPNDYILGKLGVIATFLGIVVWVPCLLLWLFGVMIEPSMSYFKLIWYVPLSMTVYYVLLTLVMGLLMLTMSAIAQRAVFIAVSWFVFFGYGPFQGLVELLAAISGSEYWGLINLALNLRQVGAWLFGADGPYEFHPIISFIVIAAAVSLCYVVIRRKIEPVEVVL